MFPKKIIGRYKGNEPDGITVGSITFKPGVSVECNVDEEMYLLISKFVAEGLFELFEFASIDDIKKLDLEINLINDNLRIINEDIDNIDADILGVKLDINDIQESLIKVNEDIDNTNTDVLGIKLDIDDMQESLVKVKDDITNLRQSISDTDSEILEVLNQISVMGNNISSVLNTLKDTEANFNEQIELIKNRLIELENK